MNLLLVDVGEWIRFPETIHELYAHLAQFIGIHYASLWIILKYFLSLEANENRGLLMMSEENLEVDFYQDP